MTDKRAHIVVIGNEKGGSGKTTTAVHLAVALARLDKRVAAIDLDTRQRSFGRHLENRADWDAKGNSKLAMPVMLPFQHSKAASLDEAAVEDARRFAELLAENERNFDFIVIDTPGSDTQLSRLAHAAANTLVTPMNDSFVDFDLLARVDPKTFEVKAPSLYSDFVWECRKKRLMARQPALDWVVMRNRISATEARNKRRLSKALDSLSQRIGFRVAPGFGERVIFRELFPMGLTMLDLPQPGLGSGFSMSHVAARQEVRQLLRTLKLPGIPESATAV
ncbi:MAG TPA: division plane positioning ATPase MipZ [Rhizomicrobium sp.]|nr:division plane positioning ATPase MipZ [Rhizomicrobium sp.]